MAFWIWNPKSYQNQKCSFRNLKVATQNRCGDICYRLWIVVLPWLSRIYLNWILQFTQNKRICHVSFTETPWKFAYLANMYFWFKDHIYVKVCQKWGFIPNSIIWINYNKCWLHLINCLPKKNFAQNRSVFTIANKQ